MMEVSWMVSKYLEAIQAGNIVPVGDLDGDGRNELFIKPFLVRRDYLYRFFGLSGRDDWPMFQHDAQHTGCYDCAQTKYIISS
jgi:hypothetical protein